MVVPPALKLTVPVGVVPLTNPLILTVVVKVTLCPETEGLTLLVTTVVVLLLLTT
jgi:hypothetical protein